MQLSEWEARALEDLRKEEGTRLIPYNDHLGYATIGIGHLIARRKVVPQDIVDWKNFTKEDAEQLLYEDFSKKVIELRKQLPLFDKLNGPRKTVLINMAFQMGVDGLLKFVNTLKMIESGDFKGAGLGMMNSLWAKQTPDRAKRMSERMIKGTYV